jgi:hypothetical protein
MSGYLKDLPSEVLQTIRTFLNPLDAALFHSSCKDLWEKRPSDVLALKDLRDFLGKSPLQRDQFGNFGEVGAVLAIPQHVLFGALACFMEDADDASVFSFMRKHVTPLAMMAEAHQNMLRERARGAPPFALEVIPLYFEAKSDAAMVLLKEKWRPSPFAVYVLLCIIDKYLPEMLPHETPSLGTVCAMGGIGDFQTLYTIGSRLLNDDIGPVESRLDRALAQMAAYLDPVEHFEQAVLLLEKLSLDYERNFVYPAIMMKSGSIMAVFE